MEGRNWDDVLEYERRQEDWGNFGIDAEDAYMFDRRFVGSRLLLFIA